MVKISLEFKSVDEAIVALGKLVGAAGPKPVVGGKSGSVAASPPVSDTPPAPATSRKPRADKGAKRGAYAPRIEPVPPIVVPQPVTNPATEAVTAPGVGSAGDTAVVEKQADPGKAADQAANPVSTPSTAASVTLEQAQAAMERVYKAKGVDVAKQILARLGTNRVKDILPASLGLFVKMATDIASFPEEQNSPAFAAKLQAYFAQ
jgi:hypothetical protein